MKKQISDELVNKIMSQLNEQDYEKRDAEDTDIEIDGITYRFKIIEDSGWEDDDKYDYRTIIFQLVQYGKNYTVESEFDVYFEQCSSRTGSYYSDWYYGYDEISRVIRVEKVIPEHTEIVWEKY